jgi:hypothetical protein
MKKPASTQRRRLGVFEPGESPSRKNSASIRLLLHDLVKEDYSGSLSAAAQGLAVALNSAEDLREYRRVGFSQHTLYRVLHDDRTISFNELDSIGLHYGVPMALVLLFTRLRSEMNNFDRDRAERTLTAFTATLSILEKALLDAPKDASGFAALPHEVFTALRDAYVEAFGVFQPRFM